MLLDRQWLAGQQSCGSKHSYIDPHRLRKRVVCRDNRFAVEANALVTEAKLLHKTLASNPAHGPTTNDQRRFSGTHRFLSAQRQEVLRALDRLGHFAQQFLQVFVAVDEINV
jgi:hypothetical protein